MRKQTPTPGGTRLCRRTFRPIMWTSSVQDPVGRQKQLRLYPNSVATPKCECDAIWYKCLKFTQLYCQLPWGDHVYWNHYAVFVITVWSFGLLLWICHLSLTPHQFFSHLPTAVELCSLVTDRHSEALKLCSIGYKVVIQLTSSMHVCR